METAKKYQVPYTYTDVDYRVLLRTTLQQHFNELMKKRRKGAERFFWEDVVSQIVGHLDRISFVDGQPFEPDFETGFGSRWKLADYLRVDHDHTRDFGDELLVIVDAYLQIVLPGFDAPFKHATQSDEAGMTFGAFLRDESALSNRYQLSLNKQRWIGIYEYEEADSHLNLSGRIRYLALLTGANPDYVNVIDAPVDFPTSPKNRAERLKLSSGFCIPGQEFSLIVMRTLCFRRRQLGLLYSVGSLIDETGGALDDLEFEAFAAERDTGAIAASAQKYGTVDFANALAIHYGTRRRQPLKKLAEGPEKANIIKRFEMLMRCML